MRYSSGSSLLALFFILCIESLALAQAPIPVVPGTFTTLTVTVTNPQGKLVRGLTEKDFTILDEKLVRPIRSFAAVDEPLSVGVLIDTSESMNSPSVRETAGTPHIIDSLSTFVQLSNPKNQYFLMSFDDQPQLLSDWSNDVTPLLGRVPAAKRKSQTAFYDALWAGIEKLKTGLHRKRVILVISDGLDGTSRHKLPDVRKLLGTTGVLLYSIGVVGTDNQMIFTGWPAGLVRPMNLRIHAGAKEALRELAETTGGIALFPTDANQMNWIANKMATELRNQYRLGFESDASSPNRRRRLRVTVTTPINAPTELKKLKLRTRQEYYSTSN
jgi:Ca-activated chloride channel family protein